MKIIYVHKIEGIPNKWSKFILEMWGHYNGNTSYTKDIPIKVEVSKFWKLEVQIMEKHRRNFKENVSDTFGKLEFLINTEGIPNWDEYWKLEVLNNIQKWRF